MVATSAAGTGETNRGGVSSGSGVCSGELADRDDRGGVAAGANCNIDGAGKDPEIAVRDGQAGLGCSASCW